MFHSVSQEKFRYACANTVILQEPVGKGYPSGSDFLLPTDWQAGIPELTPRQRAEKLPIQMYTILAANSFCLGFMFRYVCLPVSQTSNLFLRTRLYLGDVARKIRLQPHNILNCLLFPNEEWIDWQNINLAQFGSPCFPRQRLALKNNPFFVVAISPIVAWWGPEPSPSQWEV